MSIAPEIVKFACQIRPYQATLVPEKRNELTTEGGLNVAANLKLIATAIKKLKASGIQVSLFIDPDKKQIEAAKKSAAKIIELHTGRYALAKSYQQKEKFFKQLESAVNYAQTLGLVVNAGHGLDYTNVRRVAAIKGIAELNIGYSIICKALSLGLFSAVQEMRRLIK